jgi:DNA/RNA-binding domain of Phe-tRNA-synthetase-like protein
VVDVCNAISLAFAKPVAVFDVSTIAARLEVRSATDARRWSNRQSAYSAVSDATSAVLIIAEAMHDAAQPDMERLIEAVAAELRAIWSVSAKVRVLSASDPRFDL